jgi:uncharacterized phage protein (TIGR01671 family)
MLNTAREILFRGKRIDDGKWVYGNLEENEYTGDPQIEWFDYYANDAGLQRDCYYDVIDISTVGQYTGFTDKNGNKIFEGDIVSFADCSYTESGHCESSCIGIVSLDDETASFDVSNRLSAEPYEVLNECTVIGNIYDNPELLK